MRRLLSIAAFVLYLVVPSLYAQEAKPRTGHYLFAWTGDRAHQGKDFLAVIDADPSSPAYGHLLTTLVTDQTTLRVHHTEYTMPESGMLFANDHEAGRTFVFDLRDPLHPRIAATFNDMAGYTHPHSYICGCPTDMCSSVSSIPTQACIPVLSVKAAAWLRLTTTAS